jgi:hypothetical protein
VDQGWRLAISPGLHEWFSVDEYPPLSVLLSILRASGREEPTGTICWVGRRCWPYPPALLGSDGHAGDASDLRLLRDSIYIDIGGSMSAKPDRLWAIEQAARCPAVRAVIADGSGLTMADSRRLQIAATGSRTHPGIALQLVRPPGEVGELSAAKTRWRVRASGAARSEEKIRTQGWSVELLRCKGMRPNTGEMRRWLVHQDYGARATATWQKGDGDMASSLADRCDPPARSKIA